MFTRVTWLLVALTVFLVGDAKGQQITFEVRASDGTHTAVVTELNQEVTLLLYAVIQNADGLYSTDAFMSASGNLVSVEGASPLLGNLTPLIRNPAVVTSIAFQGGATTNLDGNADMELGSTNVNAAAGFVFAIGHHDTITGAPGTYGLGAGDGATEFLLGTFGWQATGALGGTTDISFAPRIRTSVLNRTIQFDSDGNFYSLPGNDSRIAASIATRISSSASGAVPIPEPSALCIFGTFATTLLSSRSHRRTSSTGCAN